MVPFIVFLEGHNGNGSSSSRKSQNKIERSPFISSGLKVKRATDNELELAKYPLC